MIEARNKEQDTRYKIQDTRRQGRRIQEYKGQEARIQGTRIQEYREQEYKRLEYKIHVLMI